MKPSPEKKTLVFDFDGTLCDSYLAALQSFNALAEEYGYRVVPEEMFPSFRDLTSKDMVGFMGINPSIFAEVTQRVLSQLHLRIHELQPFPGIAKTLHELRRQGHQLGVLTSNSETNVTQFGKQHQLEFDFIYGESSVFGKHENLQKMLRDLGTSSGQTLYVGDETRDIEAAHKAGLPVIAVSWGFNTPQVLERHRPDWMIHTPEELLSLDW